MQGTVRWFSAKGFGFIDVWSESDNELRSFYFHVSNVKNHSHLPAGATVSFDVVKAPKGPTAINVCQVAAQEGKSNVSESQSRY